MTGQQYEKEATPVLCVEDDATARGLLVHILKRRFSTVIVAKDGIEGLALFREHHPELVITDIQMPRLDGIGMARMICQEAPATPIIITTAHGEADLLLAAIDIGVSAYVLKPVTPKRLQEAISKCLQLAALEKALLRSKTRIENLLGSIQDAFFALDSCARFSYVNPKAEDYFRLPSAEILGSNFWTYFPEATAARQAFQEALTSQEPRSFEHFTPAHKTWHEVRAYPLEGGISVYLRDITQEKGAEQEIRFLAFYDKLTELPNRTLLSDRLNVAILRAKRTGQRGAVLFLDLDRFKNINDSLGHEAGDSVLKVVAKRLRTCVREPDTVARLGGDEFIILLDGFDHPDNIHSVSHRILSSVAEEIPFSGHLLRVTGSIGISFFPGDGETVEDLLKSADTAMYHGKGKGRNTYQFFRPEMNAQANHYLLMESALRKSVQNRDFFLQFQPQYDLATESLVGFEALVRWQHPELGIIPPNEFIPLSEETGLILVLGDWVFETACRQARLWMDQFPMPFRMAVNISGRQFWQGDLVDVIARGLANSGLPPEFLELELTESMVMGDVDQAIEKMGDLSSMGIRLSIDDFGTGYSSLSVLKKFPIHTLKIDKSFVKDVTSNPNDAAISTSILALAHNMNLNVVAEGIETREQLTFLRDRGCESGQGYYFSPPISAADVEAKCFSTTKDWAQPEAPFLKAAACS
jgi:diguanylate cyclase (GGDEF)-like protein/PAS domain S-box-containing protein